MTGEQSGETATASRHGHADGECWVPVFVAWAEGAPGDLDFGEREIPERLQLLLTALEPREHVIDYTEDAWTIQHPLLCRPNLSACWFSQNGTKVSRDVRRAVSENGHNPAVAEAWTGTSWEIKRDPDGEHLVVRRYERHDPR